ncbi:MAG: diguanylate cyclase domain-containing protein [Tepidanaerobacteraceae bacterium]|jgi:diguanylate cyclase (GGDEF)-like protein
MDLTYNIIINIYSIALLIIICHNSLKHDEKESLQHKLYMMVLKNTILMLVVDILSRFDGKPDTVYPVINHLGNFMIFLLNPILPSLWLLYVHVQVFQDEKETKRLIYPLLAINALNAVMVILNQFFGWFYYIDSDNIYHRGPLFLFSALITVALILVAFVLIIANRKKIEKKHYFSLVFFAVPPFVCIILQIIFYGMSLMLNSVVLSLLMVSLNIQNHSMYTDYLTGVNNRKKLEIYLKEKISTSTEDKTFSAIMIDLNSFKSINDTFGHDMGDNALQVFAKLLNSCLRSNDFIARFGGDEFFIVLDISNRMDLEEIVRRINVCVEKYNESGERPYKLDFSIGYAVYDYHSHMKAEEFQKQIDILMYENKQANKEIRRNYS